MLKNGLKFFFGSCIIYVAVSCIGSAMEDGGSNSDGGKNEASASDADGAIDRLYDSIGRPTKDALAADGSGEGCSSCPKSGTRIKIRHKTLTTTDGATLTTFVGWYDAQRKEDCAFRKAPDGKTRCLPEMTGAGIFYRDSSCATPHIFVSVGGCYVEPKYVFVQESNDCDVKKGTIYSLGKKVDTIDYSPVTIYSLTDTGYCKSSQLYGATIRYIYELGAEVSPAVFAEGTETFSTGA